MSNQLIISSSLLPIYTLGCICCEGHLQVLPVADAQQFGSPCVIKPPCPLHLFLWKSCSSALSFIKFSSVICWSISYSSLCPVNNLFIFPHAFVVWMYSLVFLRIYFPNILFTISVLFFQIVLRENFNYWVFTRALFFPCGLWAFSKMLHIPAHYLCATRISAYKESLCLFCSLYHVY